MDELASLTPDQLEAILGTDYEVILADALREKAAAQERAATQKKIGQVGDGQVFFDPAGAIENVITRRRAAKEAAAAQGRIDEALAGQKAGRRTYAEALLGGGPKPPMGPPRAADATLPPETAPTPASPLPMAPGAPPALQNATGLPPDRLAKAGVPPDIQTLIAKLRGQ